MSTQSSAGGVARRASFWLAAGLCLLVAHDAVFLVQRGPGQSLVAALREGGHAYWGAASAVLLVGGALAAIGWLLRIAGLRSRARLRPRAPIPALGWGRLALRFWIRLFVLVAIAFAIQENVEHISGHGHGIGLGALIGPEYPLALPVLAAVTGPVAMLIALVRRHEGELMRRLAAAPAWVGPAPRMGGSRRQDRAVVRRGAPMSAHRALRAPPRSPALTIR